MNSGCDMRLLSDAAWAFLELTEDPLFPVLKPEQYAVYVYGAMEDGKNQAVGLKAGQIRGKIEKLKIQVEIVKGNNPIQVHSQTLWNQGNLKVEIFQSVMEDIAVALKKQGISMTEQEIFNVHLAHEYYHCMEYLHDRQIGRSLPSVCYRTMGLISRKGWINRTREIAAHQFAREVCNLPFHPKYLDFLLWKEQDEEFAGQYEEQCRRADEWAGRVTHG